MGLLTVEPQTPSEQTKRSKYREVRRMTVGESFGELALLSDDKVRTATVVTIEKCVFATCSSQTFNEFLSNIRDKHSEHLIKWLRSTAFFGKWSRSMLLKMLKEMKELTVHRGAVVCYENDKCSRFYFICDGEFELTKKVLKPICKEEPDEVFLQTELKRLKRINREGTRGSQDY